MTVVSLRPDVQLSPVKQQFLDAMAENFDKYVEIYGNEPNTLLMGFGDMLGNATCRWHIVDQESGNICTMLLVNISHEISKAINGD